MITNDYLRIAPFINDCPNCGSGQLGENEGALEVKNNLMMRTCKCGFDFTYDADNGTTRAKIKKAVTQAVDKVRNEE